MERVRREVHYEQCELERLTGRGVGIAILDTGLYKHSDLRHRAVGFQDFTKSAQMRNPQVSSCYDDNGHGTHIGGIICGSGRDSFRRYQGMAPGAHILPVKVLDQKGNGNSADVLRAIEYVIRHKEEYQLRIMNISIGTIPKAISGERTELLQAVEEAWDAGLIVVVAAGNNGPQPMSVTTPGISRKVITVGSSDDGELPGMMRGRKKQYSGRGPTPFCIVKPEIVAPGANITSCLNQNTGYCQKSGTSMATAVVTGALALLLEKYPYMTNRDVKLRLYNRSRDLGRPKNQQGWGMLDMNLLL